MIFEFATTFFAVTLDNGFKVKAKIGDGTLSDNGETSVQLEVTREIPDPDDDALTILTYYDFDAATPEAAIVMDGQRTFGPVDAADFTAKLAIVADLDPYTPPASPPPPPPPGP